MEILKCAEFYTYTRLPQLYQLVWHILLGTVITIIEIGSYRGLHSCHNLTDR